MLECGNAGQLELQTPWFEAYKQEFLRTLSFSDHETFDYPVACELSEALQLCLHALHNNSQYPSLQFLNKLPSLHMVWSVPLQIICHVSCVTVVLI